MPFHSHLWAMKSKLDPGALVEHYRAQTISFSMLKLRCLSASEKWSLCFSLFVHSAVHVLGQIPHRKRAANLRIGRSCRQSPNTREGKRDVTKTMEELKGRHGRCDKKKKLQLELEHLHHCSFLHKMQIPMCVQKQPGYQAQPHYPYSTIVHEVPHVATAPLLCLLFFTLI